MAAEFDPRVGILRRPLEGLVPAPEGSLLPGNELDGRDRAASPKSAGRHSVPVEPRAKRCSVTQPSIAIAPNITVFFQEVISDAIRIRHVEATDAAASYLVALLCGYAHPDEAAGSTFNRPLTFVLHEAMEASGAERFRRLRSLGDHALYALGFFGGHIEQKGIDRGYVSSVGSTAYTHAAAMLRLKAQRERTRGAPDVLSEMAAKFDRFAEVLRDVSEGTLACGARDERSVVKLYERWLKTGSSRLAEELGSRGIVPTRGNGGTN
jgi:hypothetical protein